MRILGRQVRSTDRRRSTFDYLVFAVLAFVPMLISQHGKVTDDTKTYLYLDPGRYVRQAVSLWDPNVALGTVTHENIGYLLPMGPFFWAMAELHIPLWIAQALWLGALLFAAGAGMLYLCRTIGLSGPGRYVAAFGFMFTPYVLQYSGRISVILMPWSGLPWMTAFVILALRRGGWRYPALFALVVALVSGINASSILYVGIGPALWLPYSVMVLKEATWKQAWRVAWKVGVLTAGVSLWWAIGLQVEAAYGVNILKYTETLPSTSSSSSPFEVLRGLGYWFFYGASDQTGNWTQAAVAYTQHLWLVALTFTVPALAFIAAALVKWRDRAYFIVLVVAGMVLAVGPYPYYKPTAISALLKAFMADTTAGLALRSTDRASPILLLGLAVLLGSGVTAVARRMSRTGWVIAAFAGAAIAGASAPLWTGATVVNGLTQPATPPAYVQQAATALNHSHPGTRVYALPGNNFAAYRWGDTIDTVYPALLTRPFVTHEQQTMGSLPTADLLEAADTPLQDGTMNPDTLAPMASLMSAGDILVQYDQQYERYDTPNPQQLAQDLAVTPPGLSHPVSYGTPRPNVSPVGHFDEQTLARPANPGWTAPLVSYTVKDPRPIERAESLASPLVVAGNASGLVNASSVGLLADNPTIFYAGTLDSDASLRKQVLGGHANLAVTDTNRRQGYRWNGIADNEGYTQTSTEPADHSDPTDSPLDLFPLAPRTAMSTTAYNGIKSVTASSYGSPALYYPFDQPAAALDGDTDTGWLTTQFPVGQYWQVNLDQPITNNTLNLVQSLAPDPEEKITQVIITFDNDNPVRVNLGPKSLTPAGQTVTFPPHTYSILRVAISGAKLQKHHILSAGYQSTVGFNEIRIPGITADATVSMPQDLLRSAGSSSMADPLTLLMTRERGSGFPPSSDTELTLSRTFWLPTARTFSLTGQARVSPLAADNTIDQVVGRDGGSGPTVVASTSSRLTGDIQAGADAAIDGDPSTAWQPIFGLAGQHHPWVQYQLSAPLTFDTLDLGIVADQEHSVPTSVTVTAGGVSETVDLPTIADSHVAGSVTHVPVTLPKPLSGPVIRVTVDGIRTERTLNYYSQIPLAMPVGVAELGIPGLASTPPPTAIPSVCRDNLLTVDGQPVWISVQGTSAAALARDPLQVTLCGPDAAGLTLGPGDHSLRSTFGQLDGIDLDQLALASSAGGAPAPIRADGMLAATTPTTTPTVKVENQTATSMELSLSGVETTRPFELVMGQSINAGWQATVGGHSLGTPVLVDGFANGWRVDPTGLASSIHQGQVIVLLRWTPQRSVDVALIVSALIILLCVILAIIPLRRRRARRHSSRSGPADVALGGEPDLLGPAPADEPELVSAFRSAGGPTTMAMALTIGFLTGLAAALIASFLIGVLVGVATGVALRVPKSRVFLGVIAAGLVVAAGAYITVSQGIKPLHPNGGWPAGFGPAGNLVWAGVLFLGADAVVEIVMRHRAPAGGDGAVPAPVEADAGP
jgi:arabinofuranan 3-O-arabinosyltransferase